MGASGAGKTSLLNVICDTSRSNVKFSGKVLINNQHEVKQETIGSVASFVM
jgi:ABC-type multidrug transport system ATPase subunit